MRWIPIHDSLENEPQVVLIMAQLGVSKNEILGALVRFWLWADQRCAAPDDENEPGRIPNVPMDTINIIVEQSGFEDAMKDAGWLARDGGDLLIPGFSKKMGQSAKTRHLAQKRQARYREEGSVTHPSRTSVTPVTHPSRTSVTPVTHPSRTSVTPVTHPSRTSVTTGEERTEEKRTEEKRKKNPPPTGAGRGKPRTGPPAWKRVLPEEFPELDRSKTFQDAWGRWLKFHGKPYKPETVRKMLAKAQDDLPRFVASVEHSIEKDYHALYEPSGFRKNGSEYVPYWKRNGSIQEDFDLSDITTVLSDRNGTTPQGSRSVSGGNPQGSGANGRAS